MAEISQAAEAAFTQASTTPSTVKAAEKVIDDRTVYEVGFHIIPDFTEQEVESTIGTMRARLTELQAEILSEGAPKRMTLAYRIERSVSGKREKYTESYFGWIKFVAEATAAPSLATTLRSMSEILRYLLIETTREEVTTPKRAVFVSDRLEGATIQKPTTAPEKSEVISEADLDKSIESIVS